MKRIVTILLLSLGMVLGLAIPANATTPVAYTRQCRPDAEGTAYHKIKAKVWVHEQIDDKVGLWYWGRPWGTWRFVESPGNAGSWVWHLSSMRLNHGSKHGRWIYHREHPYMAWLSRPYAGYTSSIDVRWWVRTPYSDVRGFYMKCRIGPLG